MNKKMLAIACLILYLSPQVFSETISEWDGDDWNKLSQYTKECVIAGYLFAVQALCDAYGHEVPEMDRYLMIGNTVREIVYKIDAYYAVRSNRDKMLYNVIGLVAEMNKTT